MSHVTVADIERVLASRFPLERAESWDRCGLLVGDPEAEVTGVVLALDVSLDVLQRAADSDANVVVTHHPVCLEMPLAIVAGRGVGGLVHAAIDIGVALINAHTNLDRDPAAQLLIPDRLGLQALHPLESSPMPATVVTVWVPHDHVDAVLAAMFAAGAGRIGDYSACSFATQGTGRFTPGSDADPRTGERAQPSRSSESRVEVVCPRPAAPAVLAAAARVHPYEEPLVAIDEVSIARNGAALGMVCSIPPQFPDSISHLAGRAAAAFGVPPRVFGDPEKAASTVCTATGSAGSLIPQALAQGADVLVCGEVRYHDALNALEAGLTIIELGHDVSEWPLVDLLAQTVATVPGLAADRITTLAPRPQWWIAPRS